MWNTADSNILSKYPHYNKENVIFVVKRHVCLKMVEELKN